MAEKTIPLSRFFIEKSRTTATASSKWGRDIHYRDLFEQTGECVFIIGLDLRYIAANPQALSLLGYEEHELVGVPVSAVMSQDEQLGLSLHQDDIELYERVLKRKDGTTLPVEVSTSIIYNNKDQPAYIQSIARDISDRKRAEQILKQQTRILSAISSATARLLQTSNIDKRIPEVLQSLGEATGVAGCALFEVTVFSANPTISIQYQWTRPDDSSGLDVPATVQPFLTSILNATDGYSYLPKTAENSRPPQLSFTVMPIQGTLGSRSYLGLFDAQGNLSWLPSMHDVIQTAANLLGSALQRNRYEETIRLNEARNRIILETIPDLLIRIDFEGTILDYSANPDHPLYLHRDVMTERNLSSIWTEDIVEKIVGPKDPHGFTKARWLEGFRLPYSNAIYESRLHPISAQEALILIRDVTEQERLNELKSDFINRASHELRTPLTSAILMTELIQSGGTTEELREYWQVLASELNRQKILIDRLLMAGRLESGMLKLERGVIDLRLTLEESIRAVKPIATKKKINLHFESPEQPVNICGDNTALQQVFINLLNNAAKFSPEGSTVLVTVNLGETETTATISDQGMGIPPEALPHMFERFYRARNVTIAEIPGSGIGLYIVKSIVEELGGSIHVESTLNQGTKFLVRLKNGGKAE